MNPRYGLRPRAQQDIEEIWDYTAQRWSVDQAEAYIRQLKNAIEMLASSPGSGQTCDQILAGFRKFPTGSHLIFYKPTEDSIDVVRILHQRMDARRHV